MTDKFILLLYYSRRLQGIEQDQLLGSLLSFFFFLLSAICFLHTAW